MNVIEALKGSLQRSPQNDHFNLLKNFKAIKSGEHRAADKLN